MDTETKKLLSQTWRIRSKTTLGEVEELIEKRGFWQRRQTAATNNLQTINRKLADFALALGNERFGSELERAAKNE